MINCVIIDDEPGAQKILKNMLAAQSFDISVLGCARDMNSAFQLITETKPDLVFLDIQMPGGSGFELLSKFDRVTFKVIFVTAFSEFAIRAIRFAALDYVLKPVSSRELAEALDRYVESMEHNSNVSTVTANLTGITNFTKIGISSVGKIDFINLNDIIRFESDGAYTWVYMLHDKKLLSTKPIKEYEELLHDKGFCRVHRSHMVNVNQVISYHRDKNDFLVMTDNSEVEISRLKKVSFFELMGWMV